MIYLQSICFFLGPSTSSVVALHTVRAKPWPARAYLTAFRRSFMVCPVVAILDMASDEMIINNYNTNSDNFEINYSDSQSGCVGIGLHERLQPLYAKRSFSLMQCSPPTIASPSAGMYSHCSVRVAFCVERAHATSAL